MKVELKERVEVRTRLYKDLCLWVVSMIENELKNVFLIREYNYHECLNTDEPSLIEGAFVTIVLKGEFSSVEMEYLLMVLGAESYKVKAYPLSVMHIVVRVPIANKSKVAMTYAGKWTPYWKKDEQEQK